MDEFDRGKNIRVIFLLNWKNYNMLKRWQGMIGKLHNSLLFDPKIQKIFKWKDCLLKIKNLPLLSSPPNSSIQNWGNSCAYCCKDCFPTKYKIIQWHVPVIPICSTCTKVYGRLSIFVFAVTLAILATWSWCWKRNVETDI